MLGTLSTLLEADHATIGAGLVRDATPRGRELPWSAAPRRSVAARQSGAGRFDVRLPGHLSSSFRSILFATSPALSASPAKKSLVV